MTFSYRPSSSLPDTCISVRHFGTLGRRIHHLTFMPNSPSLPLPSPTPRGHYPHLNIFSPPSHIAQRSPSAHQRTHKRGPPPPRPPHPFLLLLSSPVTGGRGGPKRAQERNRGGGEGGDKRGEAEELASALLERAHQRHAHEQKAGRGQPGQDRGRGAFARWLR